MPRIDININNDIYNEQFTDVFKSKERFLLLVGGAGSGKSVMAAQKLILRMLTEKKHRFVLIRKVANTIRDSQYYEIKRLVSLYNLEPLFEFQDSKLMIHCKPTNSHIISKGLDDVEKLKSISGTTGFWIEEGTELLKKDFNQLNLRLRGKFEHYKQIIITTNPADSFHWINQRFILNTDNDCKVIHSTYLNNRFLDKENIKQIEQLKQEDKELWNIYGLGEWTSITGLIFPAWQIYANDIQPSSNDVCYGLDFGYTNPTALIKISKDSDRNIYCEQIIYRSKLTNSDLIELMKELNIEKQIPIYADTEDPNRISELRRAGFNIQEAKKAVTSGIEFIKRFKLHIKNNSQDLQDELRTYKYKQDKNGNELEEPIKFNDHAIDAMRYGIYTHGIRYWQNLINPIASQKLNLAPRQKVNKYSIDYKGY